MTTTALPGSALGQTPGDPSPPSPPLSWEGDRMFNIYIYDYCSKRGFLKTARELLAEAEIPPESRPPINARQGLLFEWWSVFWVLFTAKSSGNGTEEAMLYTQHQAAQSVQRQAQQRMQPMTRFMNGIPRQPGPMPNGVGSGQGQMQPTFPMAAPTQQPNGIPGGGPSVPGAPLQAPFQPLPPGQRPPLGPQQRVPNGMPFQSPTMAHSPSGGASQHGQTPMGLGPSPHLAHMNRGGMLPPNSMQVMNNQGAAQMNTPTQSFQQIGRLPSPSVADGQNHHMKPSPSFAARLPPGGMQPGGDMREPNITHELHRLPPATLVSAKQEAGVAEKDITAYTLEEKQRILTVAKARANRNVKPMPPGSNNAVAGPSGSNLSMQPQAQRNQQQMPQQRGNKRSSTSPADEPDTLVPKLEASPPDRKKVRRSPMGMDQNPSAPMAYIHPSQQGGPVLHQQIPNGMMRGGQQMGGGFPHQPGMPNMGNMAMVQMPMGNAMSPGMSHPGPGPGAMVGGQMTPQQQYHYRMQSMHKGNVPPGVMNSALPNAGSPSSDPSFNPNGPQGQGQQFPSGVAPNNRMGQNKPMGMMPPPSSPIINTKDQSGNKDNKAGNPNALNGHPEGSPRNAPNTGQQNAGNAGQGGTAPPTPVSGPNPGLTVPSPSAILGNPGSMNPPSQPQTSAPDSMPSNLFSTDFIQSVASSLDEFDAGSLFRSDNDINFERDFGQWFNHPEDVGSLDLK